MAEGAVLCEVLEGLADPHAGPVEGTAQGEQRQQQHHGPGGVDARVVLGPHPRASHQSSTRNAEEQAQKKTPQAPPPGVPLANRGDFPAVWAPGQRPVSKLCPQEGVAAMSTGDTGPCRLGVRTGWPRVHGAQVDYPLTVWPGTGDPLGGDFADEQTVAGAAHILLPSRGVLDRRGLVADATLDHVLVDLALHRDQALAHAAADDGCAAALWRGERGVGRRVLPQEHRGLGGAGERWEAYETQERDGPAWLDQRSSNKTQDCMCDFAAI